MIRVHCHQHCQASAEFPNEAEAIRGEWRRVVAGTESTGIEEAWFCPAAPVSGISAFLETKLQHGGGRASVLESRVRE